MPYVEGFVIPVPKKNLPAFRRMVQLQCKVWCALGALDFCECVGVDLHNEAGVSFSRLAKLQPGETVVFSWIVYKSKADRKRIIANVMKDPRLAKYMDHNALCFDAKRTACGGFKFLVQANK